MATLRWSAAPPAALIATTCSLAPIAGSTHARPPPAVRSPSTLRSHAWHGEPTVWVLTNAPPAEPSQAAHDAPITGVGSDACNRFALSACRSGVLRTWHFKPRSLAATLTLPAGVTAMHLHPHSMLAALACTDSVVRIVDAGRACIVRHFRGHKDRVTAVCVAEDGHWVLSAAMDGTLRIWDMPAAACLQVLAIGAIPTAVALSPGRQFLATTHAGERGVFLWSNRLLFGGAAGAQSPLLLHNDAG